MNHPQNNKITGIVAIFQGSGVKLGLPVQGECGAGGECTHRACANVGFPHGVQRLHLVVGNALALLSVFIGVYARHIAADQRCVAAGRMVAHGVHRALTDATVIPACQFNAVGSLAHCDAPAVDAVLFHHRTGLGESD